MARGKPREDEAVGGKGGRGPPPKSKRWVARGGSPTPPTAFLCWPRDSLGARHGYLARLLGPDARRGCSGLDGCRCLAGGAGEAAQRVVELGFGNEHRGPDPDHIPLESTGANEESLLAGCLHQGPGASSIWGL